MMKYTATLILLLAILSPAYAQNWSELSHDNQKILQPLRATWETLPVEQRQQWLNKTSDLKLMNQNQLKLAQERMAEWGSLSEKQRTHVESKLTNNLNSIDNRAEIWKSFISK